MKVLWLLTAIYASFVEHSRKDLQHCLRQFGIAISSLWLLLGNFIEVLLVEYKQGGRNRCFRTARYLWKTADACELIDLGFLGPIFTWSNSRGHFNIMKELIEDSVTSHGI